MAIKVTIDGYKDVWHAHFPIGPHTRHRINNNQTTRIDTRNFRAAIAESFADQMDGTGFKRLSGRLAIELVYKVSKRKRSDWDNYPKSIQDALNRVAWEDDSQIDAGIVRREFVASSAEESTDVYIYELD
jgi:Holliday junction resolvase RusA-like endonuclease